MFVWLFHRISGIILIALMAAQLLTGYLLGGKLDTEMKKAIANLHRSPLINSIVIFLFLYHALYGIRTILVDLGIKKERELFWIFTIGGAILYLFILKLIYIDNIFGLTAK